VAPENSDMSHGNPSLLDEHKHSTSPAEALDDLRRIRTVGAVSISAELFEKLYLSPQNVVKGELRRTFGNPTPM